MAKRLKRSNNEGSIFHQPNGSWRARVTLEGKRLSYTAKTRKDCQEWLKRTLNQVDRGLTLEGAKTTFSQVLDTWLAVKENKIRLATKEQYQRMVRKYIKVYLGQLAPKDITPARIQDFYNALLEKGTGLRTIEVNHTVLHGCLAYAQRLGLVIQNPADLVEVPRPEKREMKIWNESQVSQFLIGCPDQTFYRMAFATGMRRGELIGLKWEDLDWKMNMISVRRQVYEPEGGGFRMQEPKTERGRRAIRLGPGLIEALRAQYQKAIPLGRDLAGDRWQEYDLIFPSTIGKPRNGYAVYRKFQEALQLAGLPKIRFHDIRHTCASLILMHGIPAVQVAAMLGQSLAILMETYAHFIPGSEEQSSILMDQITTPAALDLSGLHAAVAINRKGA